MKTIIQKLSRLLFVSAFFINSVCTIANDIRVRSIVELTTDISARSAARKDANGHDCAIVRVNIPTIKSITFDNIIDDDVKYEAGEYTFYISEGTKEIQYHVEGYRTKAINFDDFNILVKGKSVYRVTLFIQSQQEKKLKEENKLIITTEPENTIVLLDGKFVGSSPLNISGISTGNHTLSFPNVDGYELTDQTIIVKGTVKKHYKLLKPHEDYEYAETYDTITKSCYFYFDNNSWRIPIGGSDNDGTGWWPEKYFRIESKGKYGIMDYFGKIIVPCEYDWVDSDSAGDFFVVTKTVDGKKKQGLYQPNKGLITPWLYREIFYRFPDENDLLMVTNDKREIGFINKNGKEVIPCIPHSYPTDKSNNCRYNLYIIYQEGNNSNPSSYMIFNKEGKALHEKSLKSVEEFHEGYAIAGDYDNNRYLVDSKGVFHAGLFEKFDKECIIRAYSEGLLLIKKGVYEQGVFNLEGKEIIPFDNYGDSDYKFPTFNGWAVLSKRVWTDRSRQDVVFIADKNGHTYTCPKENYHEPIAHFLPFMENNKIGLYDQNGNIKLPFEYDDIYAAGDYLIAQKGEKAIIYDSSFKEITTLELSDQIRIKIVKDGIIRIEDLASNKYGYINLKGEVLAGCFFDKSTLDALYLNHGDWVSMINNGMAIIALGNRYGIIDKSGNYVEPLIYRIIIPFDDGSVYARTLDGAWVDLTSKLPKNK